MLRLRTTFIIMKNIEGVEADAENHVPGE